MNKLRAGQRLASFGVVLGLLAVLAVGLAVVLFSLDARSTARTAAESERQLRETIINRCLARADYDQAANEARVVEIAGWRSFALQDAQDPDLTPAQRTQRAATWTGMADQMQKVLDHRIQTNCTSYRAVGAP